MQLRLLALFFLLGISGYAQSMELSNNLGNADDYMKNQVNSSIELAYKNLAIKPLLDDYKVQKDQALTNKNLPQYLTYNYLMEMVHNDLQTNMLLPDYITSDKAASVGWIQEYLGYFGSVRHINESFIGSLCAQARLKYGEDKQNKIEAFRQEIEQQAKIAKLNKELQQLKIEQENDQ